MGVIVKNGRSEFVMILIGFILSSVDGLKGGLEM